MSVIRKVTSKVNIKKEEIPEKQEDLSDVQEEISEKDTRRNKSSDDQTRITPRKKVCFFCSNKNEPHYFDVISIRRYLNDRGRIASRGRSGLCSKHQRRVATEIKRARFLSLLPFTVKVTH